MRPALVAIGLGAALCAAVGASAHPERPVSFPDYTLGKVPAYRTSGPALVVCKPDSGKRIARMKSESARKRSLALLPQCRFEHIQAAVDAASSGTRILVLPGVYREEPSRSFPTPDPACDGDRIKDSYGSGLILSYRGQLNCRHEENLVAILGDSDDDGRCDARCDIQLEGTGAQPSDVLLEGDKRRNNVIRADRADGVFLRNFTVQYSDANNVYVLETNGFRFDKIVSRWSREYGFLTFVSDNGLYENLVAYGNGDSGIYPGSGPEGGCKRYGIEIRNVDSYGNLLGYSGTAGNGIWVHDSRFHGNAVGISTDSAFPGHPGMPQDCAKFERNEIYSNNLDPYTSTRDRYCRIRYVDRDPKVLCPTVPAPVGTGMMIVGGNRNLVRGNRFWDNWRSGARLYWVPALNRGEPDPAKIFDTSNGNRFTANRMGIDRGGGRDPNGVDFWWDEEGVGNCWQANVAPAGSKVTSDPKRLPGCPNRAPFRKADDKKFFELVACASWNPRTLPDPPGCPWLKAPREPR